MATTRQNLRRNLSYMMGDFILDPSGPVPTCSAQGAADYSTAVDALLATMMTTTLMSGSSYYPPGLRGVRDTRLLGSLTLPVVVGP